MSNVQRIRLAKKRSSGDLFKKNGSIKGEGWFRHLTFPEAVFSIDLACHWFVLYIHLQVLKIGVYYQNENL
jgi:hypothetical protein